MRTGLAVALALLAVPLTAQQEPPRAFDAVSIRESEAAGTGGGMQLQRSGDIRVQHMRVSNLIGIAHEVDVYRVVNEPAWANATYYDIIAKANAATTRPQIFEMMRSMLADRFRLATHRETRRLQGFGLVRASALALGPGLKASTVNCEENPRGSRCNEGAITANSMKGYGLPLENIVLLASGIIGAPIVDHTGLSGTFDIDLRWSTDASPVDDAPVMETALREQLGLRLQREDVPTEVLVIDHIERPTAN